MAKTHRNTGSTDESALDRNAQPEFRVLYGFLIRVKLDDPLGDDSEQTGPQFA